MKSVAYAIDTQVVEITVSRGIEMVWALSHAYRRGIRAGVAVVGTDLVMCYSARGCQETKTLAPFPWHREFRPIRAGGRGCDDPRPPRRSEATPALDDAVALEADRMLREAAYRGSQEPYPLRRGLRRRLRPLPVFSPAVCHAVYEAIHEASRDNLPRVGRPHLLIALLALREGPAIKLMARWYSDHYSVLIVRLRTDPAYRDAGPHREDGTLLYPELELLKVAAELPSTAKYPAILTFLPRRFAASQRRRYRRHGTCYGHPILTWIEGISRREAVRAGHECVTSADVLLSTLDLHEQLVAAGVALPGSLVRYNEAGEILREHGIGYRAAVLATAGLPSLSEDAEDDLRGIPTRKWYKIWRVRGRQIPYGRTALAALRSASHDAYRAGHSCAGTTHLLVSMLTEDNGPVARLLRAMGADPGAIRAEAAARIRTQTVG